MVSPRFEICVSRVLIDEGGSNVTHISGDTGGWTKWGITLATLQRVKGAQCTSADIQSLSQADAEAIYNQLYWSPICGDSLPIGVDYEVFDMSVNMGVGTASKILQMSVGAISDGVIGPHTLALVKTADTSALINSLMSARSEHYKNIVAQNPDDAKFLNGWLSRTARVAALALSDAK